MGFGDLTFPIVPDHQWSHARLWPAHAPPVLPPHRRQTATSDSAKERASTQGKTTHTAAGSEHLDGVQNVHLERLELRLVALELAERHPALRGSLE